MVNGRGEICGEERERERRDGGLAPPWLIMFASVSLCPCIKIPVVHGMEGASCSKVRKEASMQRRRGLPAFDWDKMVLSRALAALVTRSESSPMVHVLY